MSGSHSRNRNEEDTDNMSTVTVPKTIPSPSTKSKSVSVKELARVNRRLKRQVQKENKRVEEIARLRKENDDLSYRLLELRSKRNNTGECC